MNSGFIGGLKEFFGFGGYQRTPEGYMSPQHLIFVSSLMVLMIALAVKMRKKDLRRKNRVLIAAAIIMDLLEIFKIVLLCFRENDPTHWRLNLPLFLCSIQLIALPVAAFTRGRLKEAALDFVLIFGALGAVMGTYFAGQNYAAYPVFGFDNVVSGL
ncbi:MAG: YwaF family protein, partial [Clostridia bacterium]|nr:YwaF family protein [Clostridia bacterium]